MSESKGKPDDGLNVDAIKRAGEIPESRLALVAYLGRYAAPLPLRCSDGSWVTPSREVWLAIEALAKAELERREPVDPVAEAMRDDVGPSGIQSNPVTENLEDPNDDQPF